MIVDFHGFLRRDGRSQSAEVGTKRALRDKPLHALIEDFPVLDIDICGFDSHWTIQKNWERFDRLLAEHPAQQANQQLSAAYGKGRNKYAPSRRDSAFHDAFKFLNRLVEGTMVVVTVGGLKKHKVRMMERLILPEYGSPPRPKIAGENDRFFGP